MLIFQSIIKIKTYNDLFLHFTEYEIHRLFRSPHYNKANRNPENLIDLTTHEEELLYGRNNEQNHFLSQRSSVISEILNVSPENLDALWLGHSKYNG